MRISMPDIQFYITNSCNLTCENCITYNNFKFKGHSYFKDHADYYKEWAKKINFESISFIGGEPFANPELFIWFDEVKKLWPNCDDIFVITNGTYLNKNIDLCKEYLKKGLYYEVSVHDPAQYDEIFAALENILSVLDNVKKIHIDDTDIEYCINGKLISKIQKRYIFGKNSLSEIKNRMIYMHNSDPVKAHSDCGLCHTFVNGHLYKCFLTAIGKDLASQFSINNDCSKLLTSYKPCSPFDSNNDIISFLKNIRNPIPQCKLCPEEHITTKIWPLAIKKIDILNDPN